MSEPWTADPVREAGATPGLSARPWRPAPLVWLRDPFLAERERWPLWIPVLLGGGIAFYFALPSEPPRLAGPAALVLTIGLARLLWRGPARPAGLAVLICALGFAAAQWRAERVAAPVVSHRIGPLRVEGRVVVVTDRAPGGATLVLDRLHLVRRYPMRVPERISLTMRARKAPPGIGDRVGLLGVLMPPPPPAAPGAFDYARAAWFKRIGAVGYVLGAPVLIEKPSRAGLLDGARLALADMRRTLSLRIRNQLAPPAGPVAAALLTGDESGVDAGTNQALRDAGVGHLLSISGLHMAMVAGIVFFAVRGVLALIPPVALRWPIKKWAAVAALCGAVFYLLLSGAAVPTQRSFLMTAVALGAIMIDRSPVSLRVLALAATAILLVLPESLLNVSFQLSFAAVAALMVLYEAAGARLLPGKGAGLERRALAWLLAALLSGLAAELALAPIAAFQFNRFVAYGVIANLLAIPLFGFWVMPLGVLAFALMPFGLEHWALAPMGWGIDLLLAGARRVASWRGSVLSLPAMPTIAFALMVAGGLWLLLWRRNWRWLGLVPIGAGLVVAVLARPPDVLVARDGRLVAVRNPENRLVFSSPRRGKFARDLWLRRDGLPAAPADPGIAECDAAGCLFQGPGGQRVLYAMGPEALAAQCRSALLVISPNPVPSCPSARLVIDEAALRRGGAHAVWFYGNDLRVRTAQQERGNRPWSRPPRSFRNSGAAARPAGPAP